MDKSIFFVFLLSLFCQTDLASAQQSRREVIKVTTPAEDAKTNSDTVPDVYAISGEFDRILVLRFKFDTDLLKGLEKMVKEHNIHNAVILSGIGSVRNYQVHSVSNRDFPSKNIYIKDPTLPADIVGMNGYIIAGKVHTHITLTYKDKAFGGHLEPETNVFTFAIVTIGVLKDGIDLNLVDDKTYR
jgi:predicted DNA-binding protein with PD1-like motif